MKSLVSSLVSGVLAGASAGSSATSKGQKNYGGNRDPYYAPTTYENYGTYDYKPVSIHTFFKNSKYILIDIFISLVRAYLINNLKSTKIDNQLCYIYHKDNCYFCLNNFTMNFVGGYRRKRYDFRDL